MLLKDMLFKKMQQKINCCKFWQIIKKKKKTRFVTCFNAFVGKGLSVLFNNLHQK
jgi:hypothetical protein